MLVVAVDSSSTAVSSQDPPVKDVRGEGGESDKSEGEEEVCPICLNELDEGEDLLVCSGGCHNQLHQHCMDVCECVCVCVCECVCVCVCVRVSVCVLCESPPPPGAGEQNKKNEDVYCPVCRAPWLYTGPASSITSPTPNTQEGRAGGGATSSKIGSPSQVILSDEKKQLHDQLKSVSLSTCTHRIHTCTHPHIDTCSHPRIQTVHTWAHTHTQMFGEGASADLFSSDWKHREAALALLSRESIAYLLPHVTAKIQSRREPGEDREKARAVQEVCMQVVAHAANDSVLKVFLAALVSHWVCIPCSLFLFHACVSIPYSFNSCCSYIKL